MSPGFFSWWLSLLWGSGDWLSSPPSRMSTIASRMARAKQPLPGAMSVLHVVSSLRNLKQMLAPMMSLALISWKHMRTPSQGLPRLQDHLHVPGTSLSWLESGGGWLGHESPTGWEVRQLIKWGVLERREEKRGKRHRDTLKAIFSEYFFLNCITGSKNMNTNFFLLCIIRLLSRNMVEIQMFSKKVLVSTEYCLLHFCQFDEWKIRPHCCFILHFHY